MSLVKRSRRLALRTVKLVARAAAGLRAYPDGMAPPTTRADFLAGIDTAGSVLEIGPFDCPQFEGTNVSYFDVLDQNDLKQRAIAHGRSPDRCPPIDFVSYNGDLRIVDRKFHTIFSSHVIEHQPDLIAHLQAVRNILALGGQYLMIVPDKRFCFDHFIPETTIAEVIDAATQARTHSARSVLLHSLFTTHNSAISHWLGFHGKKPRSNREQSEIDAAMTEQKHSADGEYVDVHAWYFTPEGFLDVMRALATTQLIRLIPVRVHQTAVFDQEFFVVMQAV
ncbi:hypothetical protein GCM10011529_15210 [Polymorphobacter glacialis]|uniref:Methyltransferase domain-containing protein n=1 Tax=Sandarakinorhabdus glacialis TaxID=1614636 RepID=A0A917E740_9SPHN|nr:hypothetical protein [Polymorphobacter glacialis]GGE09847.1 hypothetical protein GCM10011529_15210 [Polymorphobacter glacialis]